MRSRRKNTETERADRIYDFLPEHPHCLITDDIGERERKKKNTKGRDIP